MNEGSKGSALIGYLGDYIAFAFESFIVCMIIGLVLPAGLFAIYGVTDATHEIFVSTFYGFWLAILVGLAVKLITRNGWIALLVTMLVYTLILFGWGGVAHLLIIPAFFGFWLAVIVGLVVKRITKVGWLAWLAAIPVYMFILATC